MKKITQDLAASLVVMHNAAVWLHEAGLNHSKWWDPNNMNKDFMLHHAEPDEFFVLKIDGEAAASMVLQDSERNQSWSFIDGDTKETALYIHWLCVHRDYSSKGYVSDLIIFAEKEARRRGIERLRLDTNAEVLKLVSLYKQLGFVEKGVENNGRTATSYLEKSL